ncbi:MAG: hypothetical protein K2L53_05820, partial [Clostridia bacterium]|nr:hypothetical protein [Clostridia bacterium]
NLKAVEEHSTKKITAPKSMSVDYKGENYDVNDTSWHTATENSWYNADFYNDSNIIRIEYLNETGDSPAVPKDAGKYKVKFTIADKEKYSWESGDGSDYCIVDLEIKKKEIPLTVTTDDNGMPIVSYDINDIFKADGTPDSNFIKIRYVRTDSGGTYDDYTPPKNIGRYQATITVNHKNYKEDKTYSVSFELKVRNIDLPTFTPNSWYTYSGIKPYNYRLTYDENDVTVSVPAQFASDITMTGKNIVVSKAGTYALTLSLNDPNNTQWRGGNSQTRDIEFKVLPAIIDLEIKSNNGKIDCGYGEDSNIHIEFMDGDIYDSDVLVVDIFAEYDNEPTLLYSDLKLTVDGAFNPKLAISSLLLPTEYNLKIVLKGDSKDNYTLKYDPVILNVSQAVDDGRLNWRLMADGGYTNNSVRVNMGDNAQSANYDKTITYDGKEYSFEVRTPSGYSVYDAYKEEGFVLGYKNEKATNADTYTTQVAIKKDEDGSVEIYSITWTISKAKFDLSDVKWKYDGKVPFSTIATEMKSEIDTATLPKGLAVNLPYIGINSGNKVGDK